MAGLIVATLFEDTSRRLLRNTPITLYNTGTSVLAPVWTDPAGTVPAPNPRSTDDFGNLAATYADAETVDAVVNGGRVTLAVNLPSLVGDGSVTTTKIAAGAVTAAKVAADIATQAELDAARTADAAAQAATYVPLAPLASGLGLFDTFGRPDQGGAAANDIGAESGGKTWQTTGVVLPRIRNGRLVSPAGAGYTYLDLKRTVRSMHAGAVFTAGTATANSVTLIVTDSFNIGTWNALHIVFGRSAALIQVYVAGVPATLATYNYPVAVPADGVTVRPCGWTLVGSDLIVDMPDGTVQVYTDTRFGAVPVRQLAIWENYNITAGDAEAEIEWAAAITGSDGVGDAALPWTVQVDLFTTPAFAVGNWVVAEFAGVYGGIRYNNPSAIGDSAEWDVTLAAGTWTMEVRRTTRTDCGKEQWAIDDGAGSFTNLGGLIDDYSEAVVSDSIVNVVGIVIGSTRRRRLRVTMAGQNPATVGLYLLLAHVEFRRTA